MEVPVAEGDDRLVGLTMGLHGGKDLADGRIQRELGRILFEVHL